MALNRLVLLACPLVGMASLSCSAGGHTVCVNSTAGTVYTFGAGGDGQLGHNSTSGSTIPMQVDSLAEVAQCSAGTRHTACVTLDGHAYTFGHGVHGELGHNDRENSLVPKRVASLTNVAQCSAGDRHTACVTRDGRVFTFGYGDWAQLGHDDYDDRLVPTEVVNLSNVAMCSAGAGTVCVLSNGSVTTFADEGIWPMQTASLASISQCTASPGEFYVLCSRTDGAVFAFGTGYAGSLGLNDTLYRSDPTLVESIENVAQCSAGGAHTVCVKTNGEVFTFGYGAQGRLGHNDTAERLVPTLVTSLSASVVQCSAGYGHTVCVTEHDCVYTFGYGGSGQLGLGNIAHQLLPQLVTSFCTYELAATTESISTSVSTTTRSSTTEALDGSSTTNDLKEEMSTSWRCADAVLALLALMLQMSNLPY